MEEQTEVARIPVKRVRKTVRRSGSIVYRQTFDDAFKKHATKGTRATRLARQLFQEIIEARLGVYCRGAMLIATYSRGSGKEKAAVSVMGRDLRCYKAVKDD